MRIVQKKKAGDFIKLLGQAHDEIKKAVETKNNTTALGLLEQCQTGAISLGNMIESAEGEGIATIPILENYCELIYNIHTELASGQFVNASRIYKMLHKILIQIENSVKNDISVRKELIFLPYKASMWDSLESVWKAAIKDPNCNAYVIPIPYYDKNPDGSFKEFHYEGDQFPPYVPIIHYESYQFEEQYPDMVFIHNPYDEYNFVTSVHPFFYTKNLKQYTDKLIYIPYFVLDEIDSSDKDKVKEMEHFCTLPGIMNTDKSIVQSPKMRQVYIDVLSNFAGEKTRNIWEERILGLGSPKVDKVLSTNRENLEIPNEWKQVLQKKDGTYKKIILYNTSVSALLNKSNMMIEKIKSVFHIFKENKEEITLLWRPHPLIKATIESMRPQLWAEYEELVLVYINEGWGIYDDTADMDRAISISDAYYGDGSSLVQLYQKTGKPIMLQKV